MNKNDYDVPMKEEEILEIGNNVASGWGASCYGYERDTNRKGYIFRCVEFGEFFDTFIKDEELKLYKY